ncbi:MAG: prolyl oligopeptidase family serine peptidase [Leptospira sp.]|nr:prolyl oligopeptidase family serine peptidase [Leptospira sp.]
MSKVIRNKYLILIVLSIIILIPYLSCNSIQEYKASKIQNLEFKTYLHQGRERKYYIYNPQPKKEDLKPLVLILHGRFGSGLQVMKQTEFNALAEENNLILLYPDGYEKSWADGRGGTPADRNGIDDVGFLEDIIKVTLQKYPIDPNKVFIMGHSNGGFMTQRMLLERTHLFRAGASVVSQLSINLVKKYKPSKPINVLFLNGTDDPLVPYYGGYVSDLGEILSVDETLHQWMEWNSCSQNLDTNTINPNLSDKTTIRISSAITCVNQTKVISYSILGGGHNYPGKEDSIPFISLGEPTYDINASHEIWKFFQMVK